MLQGRDIITHNHFTALFWDHLGELVPEEILLDMVHGKIIEADIPTIRVGSSSSGLISDPPSSPIFMLDALPAATLPLYPGLEQAPNTLACIPSGMVRDIITVED